MKNENESGEMQIFDLCYVIECSFGSNENIPMFRDRRLIKKCKYYRKYEFIYTEQKC